jgi:ABC-type sugar transport system substrate-binding protein
MKKTILLVLSLVLSLIVAACSNSTTQNNNSAAENNNTANTQKKIKIGLSMSAQDALFLQNEHAKFVEVAQSNGAEVVSAFADGDVNKQMNQIKDFIAAKVDVIVCVPVDTTAIVSSVEDAKKANIPFVAMGRMPSDMTNVTFAVAVDSLETGTTAADAMKAAADKAGVEKLKVIDLVGDLKDQNAVERSEGFKKRAAELGIEIVAEVPTEWNPEKAYSRFNDAAQVNEFNAVYVPSDMLLPSVLSVLESKGKLFPVGDNNHIIIASIDGDPNALKLIREKQVDLTINTDAFDFGNLSALGAVDLANGKTPAEKKVFIPNTALTLDNLDQLADSIWGNSKSGK